MIFGVSSRLKSKSGKIPFRREGEDFSLAVFLRGLAIGAGAFYEVSPRLPVTEVESKSVSARSQAKILSASRPVWEKYREVADAFGFVSGPGG